MLWLAPSGLKGGTYKDDNGVDHVYDTTTGFATGLFHYHDFANGGTNRFAVQYGLGTGSDFSPNIQDPSDTLDQAWQFRASNSLVLELADRYSLMWALVYQRKADGTQEKSTIDWISTGIRPIYHFTEHTALAFEGGMDWVDDAVDNTTGTLYKFTIAPQITFGKTFFARPVLRAFVTYGVWTDGFKGQVGGNAFENAQDGMNFGLQTEAWW